MQTQSDTRPVRIGTALVAAGICVFASVFASAHAASPMRFDRIGLDAGLPEQAINVISQDPVGFLWVGTKMAWIAMTACALSTSRTSA